MSQSNTAKRGGTNLNLNDAVSMTTKAKYKRMERRKFAIRDALQDYCHERQVQDADDLQKLKKRPPLHVRPPIQFDNEDELQAARQENQTAITNHLLDLESLLLRERELNPNQEFSGTTVIALAGGGNGARVVWAERSDYSTVEPHRALPVIFSAIYHSQSTRGKKFKKRKYKPIENQTVL